MEAAGCHLIGEPGQPLLPCMAVNFVIPRDEAVASVKLQVGSKHQLPGSYYIFPAQADWLPWEGEEGFTWPDPGTYESCAPYPGTSAGDGDEMVAWGWNTYQLKVWPLEYIPAKRELWLHETVHIWLELADGEASQEVLPRSQEQHEEWAKELEQAVANPQDVWEWAPGGEAITGYPPAWVLILPGASEQGSTPWYDAFEDLITWRQQQGLTVLVQYAEDISPSHDYQEIRDRLKFLAANGARWALLAGDHDMVPWAEWWSGSGSVGWVPHDWCYCDLDGDWDEDADWAPELWVGRVPCLSYSEASNFVEKVRLYEDDPGYGDYAYLDSAFYEYADQCQRDTTCDQVALHQDGAVWDTIFGEYPSWNHPAPTFPLDSSVVAELNRNHYHYVSIHCHGVWEPPGVTQPDEFACLTSGYYGTASDLLSGFGPTDFGAVDNTDYYCFWHSISCNGAQLDFDNETIRSRAEIATCAYQRCAVAYAGNTRQGHVRASKDLQCFAWDQLFPQGQYRDHFNHAGVVEAQSKWRAHWAGFNAWQDELVRHSHNLFGDPATGIWTPKDMPRAKRRVPSNDAPAPVRIDWVACGPNPVTQHAILRFCMNTPAEAQVRIYDLSGRLVEVVCSAIANAGVTVHRWDCSRVSAGVYVIRIESPGAEATAKAVVVR